MTDAQFLHLLILVLALVWYGLGSLGLALILRRGGYPWRAALVTGPRVKLVSWPAGLLLGLAATYYTVGFFSLFAAAFGALVLAAFSTTIESLLLQRRLALDWDAPGVTPGFCLNLALGLAGLIVSELAALAALFSGLWRPG